jgi:hypothetical protein
MEPMIRSWDTRVVEVEDVDRHVTGTKPGCDGTMKNASEMPPSRSSHVHRNEIEANVTKAAIGSANRNGGAGG